MLRIPLNLGHALSCAILPDCCCLCGSLLPRLSEAPVCDSCLGENPAQREHCCARCGEDLFAPASSQNLPQLCRACRLAPPAFVRAVSCGVYQGTLRAALHALKYNRMAPLSRSLGARLALAIAQMAPGNPASAPNDLLVVPVPLHRSRRAERGFNQAQALATEALRNLRNSHPEWRLELSAHPLQRRRATLSQAGLTPRQRRLNLRGVFFVPQAAAVTGRHILLVDDIFTTGATARACSKAFIDAGAASVRVATVARAQRRFPLGRQPGNFVDFNLPEEGSPEEGSFPAVSASQPLSPTVH